MITDRKELDEIIGKLKAVTVPPGQACEAETHSECIADCGPDEDAYTKCIRCDGGGEVERNGGIGMCPFCQGDGKAYEPNKAYPAEGYWYIIQDGHVCLQYICEPCHELSSSPLNEMAEDEGGWPQNDDGSPVEPTRCIS